GRGRAPSPAESRSRTGGAAGRLPPPPGGRGGSRRRPVGRGDRGEEGRHAVIERYTRPAMGRLWTDEHKYATWLRVELLALEAWADLGVVPRAAVAEIRAKAAVDPARIAEIEDRLHHDGIAFTTALP